MNLKKTLQEPMRRRQTRKYEERISSQTVAYHDWILKKEKAEREGRALLGQELSIEYIAYSGCGEAFSLKDADADLTVFMGTAESRRRKKWGYWRTILPAIPRF